MEPFLNPQYVDSANKTVWNCPLKWWRAKEKTYPKLAWLARRILAIPATSAASERLFSIVGLLITAKRNRLSGIHTVETMVFLHEAFDQYLELQKLKK